MIVIRIQPASKLVPPNRKQLVYEAVLSLRAPAKVTRYWIENTASYRINLHGTSHHDSNCASGELENVEEHDVVDSIVDCVFNDDNDDDF